MNESKITTPTMKVVLVGNSGVGKTCLVNALLDLKIEQTKPTVTPAYSCYEIVRNDGKKITLEIWDTAGQEKFHSISQFFFRDSNVAFVCYQAGDNGSKNSVPDWIKRVRDQDPSCKIFLIVTKADLINKEEEEAIKNEARALISDDTGAIFDIFLTSSITKDGVIDVFAKAAELYAQSKEMESIANRAVTEERPSCCKV